MSESELLTEGELDALMDSVADRDVGVPPPSADGYSNFDFTTREQSLLSQVPALKVLGEKLADALAEDVEAVFSLAVEVRAEAPELMKFADIAVAVAEPAGICAVTIKPLAGRCHLLTTGEMLSFLVNQFFGGRNSAAPAAVTRENLTPTEWRINGLLNRSFLTAMQLAWQEKVQLTPGEPVAQLHADMFQDVNPADLALRLRFSITVGDWSGPIDLIIPYAALELVKSRLGNRGNVLELKKTDTDWEAYLRRELQIVQLELSAVFATREVSISEILRLKAGSIVPLKAPGNTQLYVEGQSFGACEHGASNGKKSIKITAL